MPKPWMRTPTGPLRDIHRRVGATILFESSGGQVDKVAHLPELRFALGEPEVETTTNRQRRGCSGDIWVLHAQGGDRWVSHPPPSDVEEGRQRPTRFA